MTNSERLQVLHRLRIYLFLSFLFRNIQSSLNHHQICTKESRHFQKETLWYISLNTVKLQIWKSVLPWHGKCVTCSSSGTWYIYRQISKSSSPVSVLTLIFRCSHILLLIMWWQRRDWNSSLSFIKINCSVNSKWLASINTLHTVWLFIPCKNCI